MKKQVTLSMPQPSIITTFYSAFKNKDPQSMAELYHDIATFEDPVFGILNSEKVKNMWSMLVERGGKDLKIEFEVLEENATSGTAIWQAWYVFSKTKRPVHNIIKASFEFRDGKIFKHTDKFNFWKWTRMALGTPGLMLGWTPFLKNKVRKQSLKALNAFINQKN